MGVLGDYLQALLPPWLAKPRGLRFQRAFADVADELREDAAFGVREAMIEEATADAYPAHLRNSSLSVVPGEAAEATLAQLRRRWLTAREGGGNDAIVEALARLGSPGAQVVSELDLELAGTIVPPFGGYQHFFFVIASVPGLQPGPNWETGNAWRSGLPWAGNSAEVAERARAMIAAIQKYKHSCSSCRFLVAPLDNTFAFDPVGLPPFTGAYRLIPTYEWWERRVSGNDIPNAFYNLSYLVP